MYICIYANESNYFATCLVLSVDLATSSDSYKCEQFIVVLQAII